MDPPPNTDYMRPELIFSKTRRLPPLPFTPPFSPGQTIFLVPGPRSDRQPPFLAPATLEQERNESAFPTRKTLPKRWLQPSSCLPAPVSLERAETAQEFFKDQSSSLLPRDFSHFFTPSLKVIFSWLLSSPSPEGWKHLPPKAPPPAVQSPLPHVFCSPCR